MVYCETERFFKSWLYQYQIFTVIMLFRNGERMKGLLKINTELSFCFSLTYSNSIQELKERIRQRTNLPLGPSIDTHGETFLSQEVVVNLLQETRRAFERCQKVSSTSITYLYQHTVWMKAFCSFSCCLCSISCLTLQTYPGMPSVSFYYWWITFVWITLTMPWKSVSQVLTWLDITYCTNKAIWKYVYWYMVYGIWFAVQSLDGIAVECELNIHATPTRNKDTTITDFVGTI